jgi:hypothetical protein
MKTVPQRSAFEQFRRTIKDLFSDRDTTTTSPEPDWPQAVAQVGAALCTKLGRARPTRRIRKALNLVLANAVTFHTDGTKVVQNSTQTYILAPHCPCPDAKQGTKLCKHTIAAELYRAALKLVCPF